MGINAFIAAHQWLNMLLGLALSVGLDWGAWGRMSLIFRTKQNCVSDHHGWHLFSIRFALLLITVLLASEIGFFPDNIRFIPTITLIVAGVAYFPLLLRDIGVFGNRTSR